MEWISEQNLLRHMKWEKCIGGDWMKRLISVASMIILLLTIIACGGESEENLLNSSTEDEVKPEVTETAADYEKEVKENIINNMKVNIGNYTFTATLEDNAAVNELVDMMKAGPVVLNLDDYSGFEKVGSLGKSLTRSDKQTTTQSGDIVLYNGNNIVIFYGSNSWSYTRIGKIDNLADWDTALGSKSVTVIFSLEE